MVPNHESDASLCPNSNNYEGLTRDATRTRNAEASSSVHQFDPNNHQESFDLNAPDMSDACVGDSTGSDSEDAEDAKEQPLEDAPF